MVSNVFGWEWRLMMVHEPKGKSICNLDPTFFGTALINSGSTRLEHWEIPTFALLLWIGSYAMESPSRTPTAKARFALQAARAS